MRFSFREEAASRVTALTPSVAQRYARPGKVMEAVVRIFSIDPTGRIDRDFGYGRRSCNAGFAKLTNLRRWAEPALGISK